MERQFTHFVLLCFFFSNSVLMLSAQEGTSLDPNLFRTYDGRNNNLSNPSWGAAGERLLRLSPAHYEDGIAAPVDARRPNARDVSNILFAQDRLMNDPHHLSDFVWVFGQFLDHELGLTPDGDETFNIPVREGDAWLDPLRMGSVVIPMRRNLFDPSTGTSPDNPREHVNVMTAFVDGSAVYGSDEYRANWLRSFESGKLKVSKGNLMPYNTITGEYDAPIDPGTPHMDNPIRIVDKLFAVGDVRANENPLLIAMHNLFVREHNLVCDELLEVHPDWSDEQLYQHARKIVGGKIQAIVYEEWLPVLGVPIAPYTGYNPEVNPQLFNEFTAAGFRVGHTLLNGNLNLLDPDGSQMERGDMTLRDVFFNPNMVTSVGGLDPFLQGMAAQRMQTFDSKVVDDVRNFLFGPPGAGGLDLVAININRGRERGLPDYNTLREALGLKKHIYFAQVNNRADVFARLMVVYQQLYKLDPWVGMLAERPYPGSVFGETLRKMMSKQFTNLRDGDRFYYENDPLLSAAEKEAIKATRMRDIVMRNTDILLMQEEVFRAKDPEELCGEVTADLQVMVHTEMGAPVADVEVAVDGESMSMTDDSGMAMVSNMNFCDGTVVAALKADDVKNGVTTLDFLRVQKHILGQELLDSPYKIIAADVDDSRSVNLTDLILLRQIVLGAIHTLPSGKDPWRFLDGAYVFSDPTQPFLEDFRQMAMEVDMMKHSGNKPMEVMALKKGDVDNSVLTTNAAIAAGVRSGVGQIWMTTRDMDLVAGKDYKIQLAVEELADLEGMQFTLRYATDALRLTEIPMSGQVLAENNLAVNAERGLIGVSWTALDEDKSASGKKLLSLRFTALRSGLLSDYVGLHQAPVAAEAYGKDGGLLELALGFVGANEDVLALRDFELDQNQPNPFKDNTFIGFQLPGESRVTLSVFDVQGRVLFQKTDHFAAGQQGLVLERAQLGQGSGLLYYQIETNYGTITRKMVLVD
jgi:hypothetical protein